MLFGSGKTERGRSFARAAEVVVITAAAPMVGTLVNPGDPYLLHSPFPWLMLAPLSVAVQHGLGAGLTSAGALAGLAAYHSLTSLTGALPASFPSWSIGCGLTALIAGSIRDAVRNRTDKLAQRADQLQDRLERSERSRHLIQLSHAKLEERVVSSRASLAGAIDDAERKLSGGHTLDELAQILLDVLATQGHLHAATLYLADHGELSVHPVACFGGTGASSAEHPLVVRAFTSGKLAAVVDQVEGAPAVDTSVLAAIPLINSRRRTVGIVAVHQMPFMMFHADHLNQVFVLAGHLTDLLFDRWNAVQSGGEIEREQPAVVVAARPSIQVEAIVQPIASERARVGRGAVRALAESNPRAVDVHVDVDLDEHEDVNLGSQSLVIASTPDDSAFDDDIWVDESVVQELREDLMAAQGFSAALQHEARAAGHSRELRHSDIVALGTRAVAESVKVSARDSRIERLVALPHAEIHVSAVSKISLDEYPGLEELEPEESSRVSLNSLERGSAVTIETRDEGTVIETKLSAEDEAKAHAAREIARAREDLAKLSTRRRKKSSVTATPSKAERLLQKSRESKQALELEAEEIARAARAADAAAAIALEASEERAIAKAVAKPVAAKPAAAAKTTPVKPAAAKPVAVKPAAAKTTAVKPAAAMPVAVQPAAIDTKTVETQASEAETNAVATKAAATTATQTKAVETRAAATTANETNAAETTTAETNASDANAAVTKAPPKTAAAKRAAAAAKPPAAKPVAATPVAKLVVSKPVAAKPAPVTTAKTSTAPAAAPHAGPRTILPPPVENARTAILAAFARKAHEDTEAGSFSRPILAASYKAPRAAVSSETESIKPQAIAAITPIPPARAAKAEEARASVRAAFQKRVAEANEARAAAEAAAISAQAAATEAAGISAQAAAAELANDSAANSAGELITQVIAKTSAAEVAATPADPTVVAHARAAMFATIAKMRSMDSSARLPRHATAASQTTAKRTPPAPPQPTHARKPEAARSAPAALTPKAPRETQRPTDVTPKGVRAARLRDEASGDREITQRASYAALREAAMRDAANRENAREVSQTIATEKREDSQTFATEIAVATPAKPASRIPAPPPAGFAAVRSVAEPASDARPRHVARSANGTRSSSR